jgi:hypothetical protein
MSFKTFIPGLILFLLCGCARNLTHFHKVRTHVRDNQFELAADMVKQNHEKYGNRDRVLYHLDRGMLFLYAADNEPAIEYLSIAEKEMKELFTKSITKEVASLVTNEYVLPYIGLDYEQVMINAFLALAYAGNREYDEALVEARKVQTKFKLLKEKHSKNEKGIKDNGFIRYISGILYEADRDYDNAFISYYNALKAYRHEATSPVPASLKHVLLALAEKEGREEDFEELSTDFGMSEWKYPGLGRSEIILVGMLGDGPTLVSKEFAGTFVDKDGHTHHLKFAVPEFLPRPCLSQGLTVLVENHRQRNAELVEDIQALCRKDLESRMPVIIAKTSVRVLAKTIANAKLKKEMYKEDAFLYNFIVGLGTDAVFDEFEHADTRACRLFPGTVYLARMAVEPGTHDLRVVNSTPNGLEYTDYSEVEVKSGEKRILLFTDLR